MRVGTNDTKFVPIFCGSAFKNKGVQPLLDAVVAYLPSPLDLPPMKASGPAGFFESLSLCHALGWSQCVWQLYLGTGRLLFAHKHMKYLAEGKG